MRRGWTGFGESHSSGAIVLEPMVHTVGSSRITLHFRLHSLLVERRKVAGTYNLQGTKCAPPVKLMIIGSHGLCALRLYQIVCQIGLMY